MLSMSYDKEIYKSQKERDNDVADLLEISQGHHLGWTLILKEKLIQTEEKKIAVLNGLPKMRMTSFGAKIAEEKSNGTMKAVKLYVGENSGKVIIYIKNEK